MAQHDAYNLLPNGSGKREWQLSTTFSSSVAVVCLALLGGLSLLTDVSVDKATDEHVGQYYTWFIHVQIMIFVGFGFLMTFLRRVPISSGDACFLCFTN